MSTRLEESEKYFSQFPAEQLKTIPCPNCKGEIKSLFPDNDEEVWDTLHICPHCDSTAWKTVTAKTITLEVPEAA